MRIGIGYDVHPFKAGKKLVLGGVEIEYEKGLDGHSDADVLVHSIMDAILGAAGMEDIGIHFPDSDNQYKNISSLKLLKIVYEKIKSKGFSIINIDSVLILEKPRVSPYFMKMKEKISETIGINKDFINIKATTNEGLGFCGRGEGAAAQSVALIE
jgi:2-C-methyl-D-erythritol 2,4-cyclodiphosphate synthase